MNSTGGGGGGVSMGDEKKEKKFLAHGFEIHNVHQHCGEDSVSMLLNGYTTLKNI